MGPIIKEIRVAAGWSLEELSSRLAQEGWTCAADQLARVESQEEGIKDFELLYFSAALGVSADELWKRMMVNRPHPDETT